MLSEQELAHHEEPRSILVDNTAWSPSTDPFFREDELHEVHQVLTEFFSESHTPSYIIDSQDTVVDPQDGAIAGPSGLCRQRLQKENSSTSDKNPVDESQVPNQMSYDCDEEELASNVSSSLIIICLILNLMENIHLLMLMLLIMMLHDNMVVCIS